MTEKYEDIINLPHWEPRNRIRMPLANRASQFAPFAALVGHDEAIKETARITEAKPELDTETANLLNEKIKLLLERIKTRPEIEVTFFVEDKRKKGGSNQTHRGGVRTIDESEGQIIFSDGRRVPLSCIIHISGNIFKEIINRD